MNICLKAFLYGAGTASFAAPLYFWWAALFGLRFLWSAVLSRTNSIMISLCFGFGYWLYLMHWMSMPLIIGGIGKYFLLLPGVLLTPLLLSLQFVLPACIAYLLSKVKCNNILIQNSMIITSFLIAFALCEYMRMLFFPFYPLSFIFLSTTLSSQIFVLFDVYFITLLIISCAITWYVLLPVFVFFIICSVYVPSYNINIDNGVTFALIQPNIKQVEKNSYIGSKQAEYLLSGMSHNAQADVIVWPEAALASILDIELFDVYEKLYQEYQNGRLLNFDNTYCIDIGEYKRLIFNNRLLIGLDYSLCLKDLNKILITGLSTQDINSKDYYNSVVQFDAQGNGEQIYDKQILIPIGEYIPFRAILPSWLNGIAATRGDYMYGKQSSVKQLKCNDKVLKVAYLICYESIFNLIKENVDCIFHISNDAWFGQSTCLNMHLEHMKVHAIAHRTCVYRCVNTGITGVIDPYGRLIASIPSGKEGVLIVPLLKK